MTVAATQPQEFTSPEDAIRFVHSLNADPKATALKNAPPAGPSLGEEAAAAGIGFELGDGEVRPLVASALCRLTLLRSPLLGDPEGTTDGDMYRALYVMCHGDEVMRPVIRYWSRMDRLEQVQGKWARSKDPKRQALYLEKMQKIEEDTLEDFTVDATEFCMRFNASTVQIGDVIMRTIMAGLEAMGMLPSEGKGEKKTASTSNG